MNEATFRARLNSILKDNAVSRYVYGKKRGKLNVKRLYKLENSDKVFKQKEIRGMKDYSITLLIDVSGSMSPVKNRVAESIKQFGLSIQKANIPLSIYTFSEVVRQIKMFNEKFIENDVIKLYNQSFGGGVRYYRCNSCGEHDCAPIEKNGKKHCPVCDYPVDRYSNGGTHDAPALHVVGNQISKIYEKNILIVITDGDGESYSQHCKTKIGKLNYADIKNAKSVVAKLRERYKDIILLGISVAEDGESFTDDIYGVRFSENIEKPEDIFLAIANLLKRHVKRK